MADWLRVDAGGRWDAVALIETLAGWHSFLVQDGRAHWLLHLECEHAAGAFDEFERLLRRWLIARSLPKTSLWLPDGRRVVVHATSATARKPQDAPPRRARRYARRGRERAIPSR